MLFFFRYSPDLTLAQLSYNSLNVLTTTTYKVLLIVSFWSIFVLLLIIYGIIFRTAKHHARQIRALEKQTSTDANKQDKAFSRTDLKIAKLTALIFGLFYLTYMPATITLVFRIFVKSMRNDEWVRIVLMATNRMISLNSMINPITYAYKDRRFREGFARLLGCSYTPDDSQSVYSNERSVN